MTDLKIEPCPFYGHHDVYMHTIDRLPENGGALYYVMCEECDSTGPTEKSKNSARFIWNETSKFARMSVRERNDYDSTP